MEVEVVSRKMIGSDIHLCFPWKQVDLGVVVLMALDVNELEGKR